jgi:AraC-like DNA-binding protein
VGSWRAVTVIARIGADERDRLLGREPVLVAYPRQLAWTGGDDLVGWAMWGHISTEDAELGKQLWISLAVRIAQLGQPYDFILDLRGLESISQGAYERIKQFAMSAKPGLRRMAILVGEPQGGVIQLGLFALSPPRFPWKAFDGYGELPVWLERRAQAELIAAAAGAVDEHRAVLPSPIAGLAALLQREPRASVARIARALGMSPRTVQRALAARGTTLSAERDRARITIAQDLLRDPSTKLDAIAAAAGCADRRGLNRLFRRLTGESPAELRARDPRVPMKPSGPSTDGRDGGAPGPGRTATPGGRSRPDRPSTSSSSRPRGHRRADRRGPGRPRPRT